jgi:hypothetical protein
MRFIQTMFFWACYFSPFIVGYFRKYPRPVWLFFVNLGLAWTVVGWFFLWVLVFPAPFEPLLRKFAAKVQGGAATGGPVGSRAPLNTDAGGAGPNRICPNGADGRMRCPTCFGRANWFDPPTTANGSPTPVRCGYCLGSGTVQCTTCSGTGKVW